MKLVLREIWRLIAEVEGGLGQGILVWVIPTKVLGVEVLLCLKTTLLIKSLVYILKLTFLICFPLLFVLDLVSRVLRLKSIELTVWILIKLITAQKVLMLIYH